MSHKEYIYTTFLHCNSSSVDLSLLESPLEALHSFFVPPRRLSLSQSSHTHHQPSITYSSTLIQTTLVVNIPLATPTIANQAKSKSSRANTTNRIRKYTPTSNTRGPNPSLSNQADLEAKNTRLRRQLRYYRYQLYYLKQPRSSRDDSENDSSNSDIINGRRVSFLHHRVGNKKLYLKLYKHYPAINIKYFKQIYQGTF